MEKRLNVILTSICCGKTYLTKSDSRYIDLDIFQGVKTRKQRQIVFDMIKAIAEKNDNVTCLFNIDRFDKLELWKIPEIKIVRIILARDYDFRCTVFAKRDIEEYGNIRIKKYKEFKEKFSEIIKLGKSYSQKYNVELQYLENGKFLKDILSQEADK
jgi:hypothetical protein